jgi:hypothetical protein
MGEHRNVGGGVTLLLVEKVHQFTCYWHTFHVMLGLQLRDHAKKRKDNTGKRLEGRNILLMTRHFIGSKKKTIIVIVIFMLTNITINRSYSIGSTSQLRSIRFGVLIGHKVRCRSAMLQETNERTLSNKRTRHI